MPDNVVINHTRIRHSNRGVGDYAESHSSREKNAENHSGDFMISFMALIRKVGIVLCGPIGFTLASLVSLYIAAILTPESSSNIENSDWLLKAAGLIILLRMVMKFISPTKESVPGIGTTLRFKRFILTELELSATLVALIFFVGWPATQQFLGIFIVLNLLLQLTLMPLSRLVVSGVTPLATNGSSPCARRVLIIGTGKQAKQAADIIADCPEMDTSLIGFLDFHRKGLWRYRDVPLIGHPDRLAEIVTNGHVDAIFLAVEQEDISSSQRLFQKAEEMGVTIAVMPSVFNTNIAKPSLVDISGLPALIYSSTPTNRVALFAKRVIDPLMALIGIIASSPFLIAVAIWIKLDSKGPVLFSQPRSGLNGKTFSLYKFRTMCNDAEEKKSTLQTLNEMSGPVFKIKDDPRISRLGKQLRKYSIDELPQLFNILKGDMSLVGPRPALPKEVSQYEPWQHRKLSVRPGLTCLWQVSGRNSIGFEEWMKLDLQYIDNWSLWLDAKLIARTIPTVLKGTGM